MLFTIVLSLLIGISILHYYYYQYCEYYIINHYYVAGIAQSVYRLGYGLDNKGIRVHFLAELGCFCLLHRFQTGSGTHY
jgi:hypothetical protein